jgi:hypothetical protein
MGPWYFQLNDTSSTGNSFELLRKTSIITSLDEKFIPSAIARLNDLVGQKTSGNGEIFYNYKKNKASGNESHAEGYATTASGERSHAEGWGSEATGNASHAEGYNTEATKLSSHAEGY